MSDEERGDIKVFKIISLAREDCGFEVNTCLHLQGEFCGLDADTDELITIIAGAAIGIESARHLSRAVHCGKTPQYRRNFKGERKQKKIVIR